MVFWLFAGLAVAASAQDVGELLFRSVEAERANRRAMAMYLFREDVRQRHFDPRGGVAGNRWMTYDVLMLEGRPYHRRVAIDGRPLPPEEEAQEQQRMEQVAAERRRNPSLRSPADRARRVVPYDQLSRLLRVRTGGEETADGRPCWLVLGSPKRGAEPRTRDEERLAESRVKVWIDKTTLHRVRMEVQGPQDQRTTFEYAQQDGDIWLIKRITARERQGRTLIETEQVYSDYRRFSAESSIRIDEAR